MEAFNPPLNKKFYFLYFTIGILFVCVAVAIRVIERDGPGDLPGDLLVIGCTGAAGLALGATIYLLAKGNELKNMIVYCTWMFVRYFLSFVFLGYGFVKIVGLQFINSLEMLDVKILELNRNDSGVAWFFFGFSNSYEMFLGWSEAIAAVLLLFRRTSMLGTCMLLAISSNIVAINYWYDIHVKLNSTIYFLMTIWILLYQYPRALGFFFHDAAMEKPAYPSFKFSSVTQNTLRKLTFVVVGGMAGYQAWDNFYRFPKEFGYNNVTTLKGVWKAERVVTTLADTVWVNELRKAVFYFNDYGRGSIKNGLAIVSIFQFTESGPDSIQFSKIAYNPESNFRGTYKKMNAALELNGQWSGKPMTILLREAPEYKLGTVEIKHTEIPLPLNELARFAGRYKIGSGFTVSLVLKDNKLFRVSEGLPDVELISLGKNRFGYKGRNTYWQFNVSYTGDVTGGLFTTFGNDFKVWRIQDK